MPSNFHAFASPAVTLAFLILLRYIEDHEVEYIARLKEAVALESVSAWADSRPNIVKMMEWTLAWVEKLGGTARLEVLFYEVRLLLKASLERRIES